MTINFAEVIFCMKKHLRREKEVHEEFSFDEKAEFTEMITTQRGFQANSRIITVSDTLLEELINLKR